MSRLQALLIAAIAVVVLFVGAIGGIYYYLFGAPERTAAELLPANTIALATIPNGAALVEAYELSQAHALAASPGSKPLHDALVGMLGQKNVDLLHVFLPNLSGQSFIAVTQFDPDHPESMGIIAAMKPKAGMGDFGAFLDKLKESHPDEIRLCQTGKSNVAGHDYDWIQGPAMPNRICVAHIRGWIITAWGEASLQDWIERFENRSTTSSLADDADYRKALSRIGDNPMALAYMNYRGGVGAVQKRLAKTNPALGDFLAGKLNDLGGAAVATCFENGEIVDRYALLMPRPSQLAAGLGADPCPFDTLKFTGRETRLYWAASINWKQCLENLKEEQRVIPPNSPVAPALGALEDWARGAELDVQRNLIDALGPEVSLQAEWSDEGDFPSVGLFVKVDKPDDFKPVINALIATAHQTYANSAVVKKISFGGRDFATLNFVPASPITPTVTEDGPYFGIFLTANQAVRSFQRETSMNLTHDDNFNRQIGDRRNGAQQIVFLDSPYMLKRAYPMALDYLTKAAATNGALAKAMKGQPWPADLGWLSPMGTWSCAVTPDESGLEACSVSGIGNQAIFLTGLGVGALNAAQEYALLPKPAPPQAGQITPPSTGVGTPLPAAPSANATLSTPSPSQ
jgi:hypothetical protein